MAFLRQSTGLLLEGAQQDIDDTRVCGARTQYAEGRTCDSQRFSGVEKQPTRELVGLVSRRAELERFQGGLCRTSAHELFFWLTHIGALS